jgi:hypothetical protein
LIIIDYKIFYFYSRKLYFIKNLVEKLAVSKKATEDAVADVVADAAADKTADKKATVADDQPPRSRPSAPRNSL